MLIRLRRSLAEADYGALGLELLLVIVGILIAFQIDSWHEERREREQEYQYLLRLKDDLQSEVAVMEQSINYAEERLENVRLLEQISENPELARNHPRDVMMAVEQVTWRSFPRISGNVYGELKATGNLALIRSDQLRDNLWEYYSFYDHISVIGTNLELQQVFTHLTAGILSTAELTVIQGIRQEREHWRVPSDRAYEVALEFSQQDEAIALLPSIAQHHVHNQRFVGSAIKRARQLIQNLEDILIRGTLQ